ncbi:hypothetical protein [Mycolicibacterium mucogenicum]|uniref:Uncharacterized protein n=1 Tax=Mycolicibacterium mucogenicum DSM 44124 TaxID=1226753 RepID=A0A8E4RB13_MYCMU|nr:hypothetical protein [Mycolicibacterium mucogenicum]QPG70923.1 hypothetical protein C1S78_008250 [Mycolicibacterium mucogenicum DSM 44124]
MTLKGRLRPQQHGRVVGRPRPDPGSHVGDLAADVLWLVDSGADLTTVRNCIGEQFGYRPVHGAHALGADGKRFGLVVEGIGAEFFVEDHAGKLRTVQSRGRMCIASDDAKSDLLGMNHLADSGATLMWNPRSGEGSLRTSLAAGLAAAARGIFRRLTGS